MADAYVKFLYKRRIINDDWIWNRLRSASEYVRASGFDKKQYVNARYTIGRLLLDFPFYQCGRGVSFLKEIRKMKNEIDLIKGCQKKLDEKKIFGLINNN